MPQTFKNNIRAITLIIVGVLSEFITVSLVYLDLILRQGPIEVRGVDNDFGSIGLRGILNLAVHFAEDPPTFHIEVTQALEAGLYTNFTTQDVAIDFGEFFAASESPDSNAASAFMRST